jgi:hypothetical protein
LEELCFNGGGREFEREVALAPGILRQEFPLFDFLGIKITKDTSGVEFLEAFLNIMVVHELLEMDG